MPPSAGAHRPVPDERAGFWREVAVRLIVAWLSPSAAVLGLVGMAAWRVDVMLPKIAPQVTAAARNAAAASAEWTKPTASEPHGFAEAVRTGVDDFFAESRDVTKAVLAPCRKGKCGLIPGVQQVVSSSGKAIDTMQEQVAANGKVAAAAMGTMNGLAAEAKTFFGQGTTDLDTLNGTIGQMTTLGKVYATTGNTLNTYLAENQAHMASMLANLDTTTGHVAGITGDLYDFEHPYVHPPKCKTRGCRFKRHFVAPLGAVLGFSRDAYEGSLFFHSVPVRVTH